MGGGVCPHGKRRDKCRQCGGNSFCTHGKRKAMCKSCGGSGLCWHGVAKYNCAECMSTHHKLDNGAWCVVCVETRLSQRRVMLGVSTCSKCDGARPKRVETIVFDKLTAAWNEAYNEDLPPPTIKDSQFLGCGAEKRRPDLCWAGTDRIVHVEIDEHSHRSREVACELAKLDQTNFGVDGVRKPTLFLRFNPDDGDLERGVDSLRTALRAALGTADCAPRLCPVRANVCYISYPPGSKHVAAAAAATASINVIELTVLTKPHLQQALQRI